MEAVPTAAMAKPTSSACPATLPRRPHSCTPRASGAEHVIDAKIETVWRKRGLDGRRGVDIVVELGEPRSFTSIAPSPLPPIAEAPIPRRLIGMLIPSSHGAAREGR